MQRMQDRGQEAENSENSNPNTVVMPLPEKSRFGDATNAPHSGPAEPASKKLQTDPNQVILEGFLMKETKGRDSLCSVEARDACTKCYCAQSPPGSHKVLKQ